MSETSRCGQAVREAQECFNLVKDAMIADSNRTQAIREELRLPRIDYQMDHALEAGFSQWTSGDDCLLRLKSQCSALEATSKCLESERGMMNAMKRALDLLKQKQRSGGDSRITKSRKRGATSGSRFRCDEDDDEDDGYFAPLMSQKRY
eukprot:Hpha_TRINITY_DN28696_c0_g1::TRINITY_DN28696_c0_g1_i1::g.156384::m.156384